MALNKSLLEMRTGVRRFANIQGTTALARHPNADLNDYICIALGSLERRLNSALPDQRILSSTIIATSRDVSLYPLPADFDSLISIELTSSGHRDWLTAYEMPERPALVSPDANTSGIPSTYRLRAGNIEFLPTPNGVYSPQLWYVPTASQLTLDADTYDTISRLDMYVYAYAARLVAIKDKNWDLRDACNEVMNELEPEIDQLGRNRDRNSPPRIVDARERDPWGRSRRR